MSDIGETSLPPSQAPSRAHGEAQLGRAARSFSLVTLVSRFGGLIREVLMARVFGDTALGSSFTVGFAIPNLFRRLFGEGALSAAFIPEYTRAAQEDRAHAERFATMVVGTLGIFTGALTAVLELALLLILLIAPVDPERALSLKLIMLMLPFMPFICMTAIMGGMLQVHGKFGPSASGPIILNGFIIAVALWHVFHGTHGGPTTAYALGIATVLSGFTQAVYFAWLLRRDVHWRRDFDSARSRGRRMLVKMGPVLIGLGTLQLNSFIDQLISMWPIWVGPTILGFTYPLDERTGIILSAGQRLYQFPLGVFGIAVATAVFPLLSRHADEPEHFVATLRRGLRLSMFIALPASVGLVLVRHDAMAVLYSFDSKGFSADGVARSAQVLAGYAPAIWAYSLNHVFTRAFYARGNTRTPMRVAVSMVLLNLALNCTLIWFLRDAGLAWSTSIAAIVQCCVLGLLCSRVSGTPILNAEVARAFAKTLLAGLAMGAAVWTAQTLMPAATGWLGHLARLCVACAVGASVYPACSIAARLPELSWLLHRRVPDRANGSES